MERIVRGPGHDIWIETLERPFAFRSPFDGEDFVLLLVDGLGAVPEERATLGGELVRQGCRYAVCAGLESSKWEDAVDWAFVSTDPDFHPPDDRFVMTTRHEGEAVSEVVGWFLRSTAFDDFTPANFLVLLIGSQPAVEVEIRRAVARLAGGWSPP